MWLMRSLLWCMSLVASQQVGSWFSNQGLNLAPGNGRQILNHWTTREVPTIVIGFMSCNFKILLKAI